MLRMILIALIALVIIAVFVGLLFKHEIQTWIHKINRKDDLKQLEHKLQRLEIDHDFHSETIGHEIQADMVKREIESTKQTIEDIKNGRE